FLKGVAKYAHTDSRHQNLQAFVSIGHFHPAGGRARNLQNSLRRNWRRNVERASTSTCRFYGGLIDCGICQ
ncbi:MAG: hypothetical protein WA650_19320, partial [Bradyrhizobium sp.]